jgi:hypothetical protein
MDESRHSMALGLAYLFGTGATLVVLTLLLPHGRGADEPAIVALALAAYVTAAAVGLRGGSLPPIAFTLIPAMGAVLVALATYWGGEMARAYPLFYVWVTVYSFYFLGTARAVGLTLWAAATYACVLLARDLTPIPWVDWILTLGTTLVAGTFVGRLTFRLRERAADLDSAAGLANALSARGDVGWARDAICVAALDACGAVAAVLVEAGAITGHAGDDALARRTAERPDVAEAAEDGERRTVGRHEALVQPVLRHGRPAAVLAVAWPAPQRLLSERAATAAALFAAEAAVVFEREERLSGERERRALEINDSIVQGLVVAKYALDLGRTDQGAHAVEDTLARARELIDRQLDNGGTVSVRPGDLRRAAPGFGDRSY